MKESNGRIFIFYITAFLLFIFLKEYYYSNLENKTRKISPESTTIVIFVYFLPFPPNLFM